MTDVTKFKKSIKSIISQKYELKFLGGRENLDNIVRKLPEKKAEEIYKWIAGIFKKEVAPIYTASKRKYKDWRIRDLLSFRKEFKIESTEYRILFIKVKNSFYIEFHIGDHKYYDRIRKQLDLTKKNY